MTVTILWFFLKMIWIGLSCVIVVFPDHTHLLSKLDLFRSGSILYHCFSMLCVICSFSFILNRELVALFNCLHGVLLLMLSCCGLDCCV